MGLKDHEIRELTNDVRDDMTCKMFHVKFPQCLREIISKAINDSLAKMDARTDRDGNWSDSLINESSDYYSIDVGN